MRSCRLLPFVCVFLAESCEIATCQGWAQCLRTTLLTRCTSPFVVICGEARNIFRCDARMVSL
jgi:hypothetical protein